MCCFLFWMFCRCFPTNLICRTSSFNFSRRKSSLDNSAPSCGCTMKGPNWKWRPQHFVWKQRTPSKLWHHQNSLKYFMVSFLKISSCDTLLMLLLLLLLLLPTFWAKYLKFFEWVFTFRSVFHLSNQQTVTLEVFLTQHALHKGVDKPRFYGFQATLYRKYGATPCEYSYGISGCCISNKPYNHHLWLWVHRATFSICVQNHPLCCNSRCF